MGVRIVYGRSGSGKSELCFSQIQSVLHKEDGPILLLVPEQLSNYAERKMVETVGYTCMDRVEVLSFERLAHRLCPAKGRMAIDNAGKSMLIEFGIRKLSDTLSYFNTAVQRGGLLADILRQIQEFEHYEISPNQLSDMVKDEHMEGNLRQKLADLLQIYTWYLARMQGVYDADRHLTELAEFLDQQDALAGYHIWIDEFSDFLPQYFSVVRALIRQAADVTFFICADTKSQGNFQPGIDAIKDIVSLCHEESIPVEKYPLTMNMRQEKGSALYHLEKYYPSISYVPYEQETDAISLYCYDTLYQEVEACAQHIWDLCKNHQYSFSDIAIACGNVEDYLPFIRVVFSQYHIAYYADVKQQASHHPVLLVLESVFAMLEKNYQTETVMAYLKTGLSPLERREAHALENFVLARGIRYQKWVNDDWWETQILRAKEREDEQAANDFSRFNAMRKTIMAPILKLQESLKNSNGTVEAYATLVYRFLEDIFLPDRIEEMVTEFRQNGHLSLADEYSKIFEIILTVLDECVSLFSQERMPFDDFAHILEHAFFTYEISTIPQRLDCVEVGDCVRSKVKDKKALFVLGAVSGAIPSGRAVEGILSDRERMVLANKDLVLAQGALQKAMDEDFLIYRLLTAPREYLILSMPLTSFENMAMRPSEITARLKKLFPKLKLKKDDIDLSHIEWDRFIMAEPSFLYSVLGAKNTFYDFACDEGYLELWNYYASHEEYAAACDRIYAATEYTSLSYPLKQEFLHKIYPQDIYTSVHRLEKFKKCPYSYFSEFVLQLKERKILQATSQSYGTLLHELVEKFCREALKKYESFQNLTADVCRELVGMVVDTAMQEETNRDLNESARFCFLVERLKRVLFYIIWVMVLQLNAGDFSVAAEEIRFADGKDSTIPALHIPFLPGRDVVVSGFIDRVDVAHMDEGDIFRIVDYKSYKKTFDFSHLYEGVDLQLMLYLDAFWEHSSAEPAGMYYFDLLDNKLMTDMPVNVNEYQMAMQNRYQLNGLTIGDDNMIAAQDHAMPGKSSVIPVGYTLKGELTKTSLVTNREQFVALRRHVRHLVSEIGREMAKGNIEVSPLRMDGALSCRYCAYHTICGFDARENGSKIRFCDRQKPIQILDKLNQEIEERKKNNDRI